MSDPSVLPRMALPRPPQVLLLSLPRRPVLPRLMLMRRLELLPHPSVLLQDLLEALHLQALLLQPRLMALHSQEALLLRCWLAQQMGCRRSRRPPPQVLGHWLRC
jgi:hypothetical protein